MSERDRLDRISRRKLMKSMTTTAIAAAGVGIVTDVADAKANSNAIYFEEATSNEVSKIATAVRADSRFKPIAETIEANYEVTIETDPTVYKTLDENDNVFYFGNFGARSEPGKIAPEVAFKFQDSVQTIEGAVTRYENGQPVEVEEYIFTGSSVITSTTSISIPSQNEISVSPDANTGSETPYGLDQCAWCQKAVPIACRVGCTGGLKSVCIAIDAILGGDQTCLDVIGQICSNIQEICSQEFTTYFACEYVGLC